MYDFKTLVKRDVQGSSKWLMMKNLKDDVSDDVSPFSVADSDIKMAPEIIEGLKEYLDEMILGYTIPLDSYYQAIIDWNLRRHDFLIEKDWIVTTPGVVKAIGDIIEAFTLENDGVIIMPPVYHYFHKIIGNLNRAVVNNPLTETDGYYTIDYEGLEKLAAVATNKILLFCSPHNPVGRVWKKDELLKVLEIAERHDLIIISDEIHNDLIMPNQKHYLLASINEIGANRTITALSPSKSFNLAGLKTSNLIVKNPQLRETLNNQLAKTAGNGLSAIGPKALELAYNHAEAWFEEFLKLIETNYLMAKDFIEENLPMLKVSDLEGTYLLWVNMKALGFKEPELNEFLINKCEFFIDSGLKFGEPGEGYIRINLASPTETLKTALKRLEKGIKSL